MSMADEYIRRQDMCDAVEAMDIIPSVDGKGNPTNTEDFRVQFLGTVLKVKPADVVQVVRCKDCKHWQHGMIGMGCYWDTDYPHEENDFCSHGEREE